MGPQHPSTHGLYRAILTLDGETVVDVESVLGHLHRGLEKIAENRTYSQFVPYTDRLDYISSQLNNLGYVQTVEKLMGIEVPERAEYLRVILAELQRIANHLVYLGSLSLDFSGWTGWLYTWRDREKILDLFEMTGGSRLTTSYMRIGGFNEDVPEEFWPALKSLVAELPRDFAEYDGLLTGNEIFQARLKGVGRLSAEDALAYGITGPNLRASGVPFDLRKNHPYGCYSRFDFDIPTGTNGDSFDRWVMRTEEMRQSVRIIEQAMRDIPRGEVKAKVPKVIRPPKGEVYHQIEGSKGIVAYYMISDGSTKPYRLHIRGPSYVNLGALPLMTKGESLQDFVATFASIDIVLGEVDR